MFRDGGVEVEVREGVEWWRGAFGLLRDEGRQGGCECHVWRTFLLIIISQKRILFSP